MASSLRSTPLALARSTSHLNAQVDWRDGDDDRVSIFDQLRSHASPYAQSVHDAASVVTSASKSVFEHVNLGPAPTASAPAAQPVVVEGVAQFNTSMGFSATGAAKSPTNRIFPTTHIVGRALVLSGAETLASGVMSGKKRQVIAGSLLLAGGALSSIGALATSQRTLRPNYAKTARYIGAANLLGLAALGGGGALRQLAAIKNSDALSIVAMVLLGLGTVEAAVVGGAALARQEQVASTMPTSRRANWALWSLDAGVVTTMTYGLAIRLNQFAPLIDNLILGSAYTACLGGTVWQYADGAWYHRKSAALTPLMKTTWVPTAMMTTAFASKIGVLAGVKFAVDGYAALSEDKVLLASQETQARLALILGGTGTLLSLLFVSVPQLAYFHPNLKESGHTSPWAVTLAVHVGAAVLALGAGLREWAALQRNLNLARGAMAIAAMGAFSVVACSSAGLAASEFNRGRAPLRHRAEVALGLQAFGLGIGVAYGLAIRDNGYSVLIDDVLLAASYLALGIGGAMSYASSKLDRSSYLWAQAQGLDRIDEEYPLETLR